MIRAGASSGSFASAPVRLCPASTVSMFVPSRSISASSPACEEDDRPRTATIAAVPIAIPSADSAARSGRARSPTLVTRSPSFSRSRPPGGAHVSETTRPSSIRIWRGS